MFLRNRIITYATLLGNEARAAGINGCFDDADAKRRFEATSFRNAPRRLRPARRRGAAADETPAPEPAAPNGQSLLFRMSSRKRLSPSGR